MSDGRKKTRNSKVGKVDRPDVFKYHDYRLFLKDWLAYLKASQSSFSLRSISKQIGIAPSYLSMIISGSRRLSQIAIAKLCPAFGLSETEQSYFELLVRLGDADVHELKLHTLARMNRFLAYRKLNPLESSTYMYLSHWYYVAIREMACLPHFSSDPKWIQAHLKHPVDLGEIQEAWKFLIDRQFIEIQPDGKVIPPPHSLDCQGGVYRVALSQFHREMFALAAQSIETTPSDQRSILGYTLTVNQEQFERVRLMLSEVYEKIKNISEENKPGKSVYQIELALFPITREPEESKK
jgi:uncharacterized protein (TIGR02147 family)